jgi:predicted nucleic-acid-binding protein
MTTPVDSNLLVRHFTGDPADLAARATSFIRSASIGELLLLDVHVAECVYVLEGPYRQSRGDVARLVGSVLGVPSIVVEHPPAVRRALDLYAEHGFDYPDAYLVATAEVGGFTHVAGFDRFDAKLRKASTVRRLDPR